MIAEKVLQKALEKIAKVPKATDSENKIENSKKLGNDFRREEVIKSWHKWARSPLAHLQVMKFKCICSSGTYIRTLARDIADEFGTEGVAWSIKRTKIGKYKMLFNKFGFWINTY